MHSLVLFKSPTPNLALQLFRKDLQNQRNFNHFQQNTFAKIEASAISWVRIYAMMGVLQVPIIKINGNYKECEKFLAQDEGNENAINCTLLYQDRSKYF